MRIPWGALALALAAAACDDEASPAHDSGPGSGDDASRPDAGDPGDGDAGDQGGEDSGAPGEDAGPELPVGSAGCGHADPPVGARQLEVRGENGDYLVSLPAAYDAAHPYPLGFAFHGFGRTHENCHDGDCWGFQDAMSEVAILVYPKSFSDGWTDDAVRDQNAELFAGILDVMEAEYCVDEARVFVAGTSSGATFVNILACRYGDRLLAVAPVAGSLPERDGCVGRPSALVIHGVDDYHVLFEYGEEARDYFVALDGCSPDPVPELSGLHDRVVANRETHECADYPDCDDGRAVRWCEHSEGGYDGSTHGWPQFGGEAIWEFVSGL